MFYFLIVEKVSPTVESKGGLKYDLVLQTPVVGTPLRKPLTPSSRQISIEDIESKLKQAEIRRQSFEAQKVSQAKEITEKICELRVKQQEYESEFKAASRQSLEKRLEVSKENREKILSGIQEKQKEHATRVEKAKRKLSVENSKEKLDRIQKKIALATEERETKIAALKERLKNHVRTLNFWK